MFKGDGSRTSELVITTLTGDRARMHMPDSIDMALVQAALKDPTTDGVPAVLALDGKNQIFWMPVTQLGEATITPSGGKARLSRPPSSGLVTYAFWLRPRSLDDLGEEAQRAFDENIQRTLRFRMLEALGRCGVHSIPRLIVVTRKRPGEERGGIDVLHLSEIASTELGRGCLRGAPNSNRDHTTAEQPSV